MIETMVAISILSTIFIALMYAFPFGISINKSAKSFTTASYLAQEKIESLLSLGYDNLIVGTLETKQRLSSNPDSFLYHYLRQTTVEYVDGSLQTSATDLGLKKIITTVYFTDAIAKNEKSYNITTLISQR